MSVTPFLPSDARLPATAIGDKGYVRSAAEHASDDVAPIGVPIASALWDAMQVLGAASPQSRDDLLLALGKFPVFETLASFAATHGMTIRIDDRAGRGRQKYPQVVLFEDGSAACVMSYSKTEGYACRTPEGIEHIDAKVFARLVTAERILVERTEAPPQDLDARTAWHNVRRLGQLVARTHKAQLSQLLTAALLSNVLLVVLPLFTTTVYDRVVPYGAFETLAALCIGVVIVFAIDAGLRMTRVNLQEAIGVGIGLDLQAEFYRKLVRAPLSASRAPASGVPALLVDIEGAANIVPALSASLLADLPFVAVMLLLVAYLGGVVAVVPLLGVFAVAAIAVLGSIRARKATALSHKLRVRVQDQALESASMLTTLKMARAESALIERWAESTDAAAYAAHTSRQASAWSAQLSVVMTQLIIACTVAVGAIEINAGQMTLGNLAACVLLIGRIIAPANTAATGIGQLLNMRQSISGFFSVVDRSEESGGDPATHSTRPLAGAVELSAVSLKYPGAVAASLRNVGVSIKPGERIGIVGRNGSGKSTLLKLLPRLYEPDSGTLMFDGVDARQIPPQHLRAGISLMGQDTVLINDTLRANICLGAGEVDAADFERAAELSGVAEFARRHPEGYNVAVGVRGEALSGGERQAVGLARIILRGPRIVLLDEPTAAMDNAAEAKLMRLLPGFLEGRTLILATHRMQLLNLVDRIIWMEQGQIVADGPKAQVLATLSKAA